eukprot:4043369-Prymnesium_polylepis.1
MDARLGGATFAVPAASSLALRAVCSLQVDRRVTHRKAQDVTGGQTRDHDVARSQAPSRVTEEEEEEEGLSVRIVFFFFFFA